MNNNDYTIPTKFIFSLIETHYKDNIILKQTHICVYSNSFKEAKQSLIELFDQNFKIINNNETILSYSFFINKNNIIIGELNNKPLWETLNVY